MKEGAKAYACLNKELSVRLKSSSGGVFDALAKTVINQGGVVFGAVIERNGTVMHAMAQSAAELDKMSGSKYVQSRTGNTFRMAREQLEAGRPVLYSGTPCHIAGLLRFFERGGVKESGGKLYTAAVACHGIVPDEVWKKYLGYLQRRYGIDAGNLRTINFRDKHNGWERYSITVEDNRGHCYRRYYKKDLYMMLFLENISLKKACYDCAFKGGSIPADFILGDFWGIEKTDRKLNDNRGVSLVIVNEGNGSQLWEMAGDKMIQKEITMKLACRYNPALTESAEYNVLRDYFCQRPNRENFEALARRATKKSPVRLIYGQARELKSLLRTFLKRFVKALE